MFYTMALAQFRHCLVCHGGMSADLAHRFTLHSLKATVLCWANALGLAEPERAAQGHHRSRSASQGVLPNTAGMAFSHSLGAKGPSWRRYIKAGLLMFLWTVVQVA